MLSEAKRLAILPSAGSFASLRMTNFAFLCQFVSPLLSDFY